jgi:hypothetical protein
VFYDKGEKKISDVNPLEWWKAKCASALMVDACYRDVAPTARLIMSTPCGTAASERKVGLVRRVFTPSRNCTSASTLQDEVRVAHYMKDPDYSIEKVFAKLEKLISDEQKGKK